jgi:CotS family spore coat protein
MHFNSHYKQALKAVSDLKNSKYFDVIENHRPLNELCHHDTANHNFLITSDLEVYIIDFDYCIVDSHLHDLASIIIRNMRYGNWNFDILNYIVEIYSKKIKVTDDDMHLIFCLMQFPQDFWQVGLQYYIEKQPWSEEYFMKKLTRVTEDHKMRFNFINEFGARFKED